MKLFERGRIGALESRNRIAMGSGTQPSEVNQLVKQYDVMAPIMKSMAGKGRAGGFVSRLLSTFGG